MYSDFSFLFCTQFVTPLLNVLYFSGDDITRFKNVCTLFVTLEDEYECSDCISGTKGTSMFLPKNFNVVDSLISNFYG